MTESGLRGAWALTARPIIARALAQSCATTGLSYLGASATPPADLELMGAAVLVDLATSTAWSRSEAEAVVLLTPSTMSSALTDNLRKGVDAVITLDDRLEALDEGVRAVTAGSAYISPVAARLLLSLHRTQTTRPRTPPEVELSPRERDVLAAMVDGLTTKATARRLGIAMKTVEAHRTRLFDRLAVRTQTEAVTLALTNPSLLRVR